MSGMGGMGMGMNRMGGGMMNRGMGMNPQQPVQTDANGNPIPPQPGSPTAAAGAPASKAQILLSGAQEITQAFVNLVEVTIQGMVLGLSAWMTYAQVQQVGQMPGMNMLEGGPQRAAGAQPGAPQPHAAAAAAGKGAGSAGSWVSRGTRRQLLSFALSMALYYAITRLFSRLSRALSRPSAPQPIGLLPDSDDESVDLEAVYNAAGDCHAVALHPYAAEHEDELSFNMNDKFLVHDRDGPWWTASLVGASETRGLIPSNLVQLAGKNKI
eukprot:TRINITY_DN6370_c0_g1_i1.p1 TRINITY_DN6370_c0_g1~~TRINITY_DN6370_c0_g1_i1.p1  ORF type:complete len:269 (+),score=89.61 TRINITY_DN6370_c0_g1_i1:3-809(+)